MVNMLLKDKRDAGKSNKQTSLYWDLHLQVLTPSSVNSQQPSECVQAVNSSRFCLWSRIFHTSEDSEISVCLSESARYRKEAKSNFYQPGSKRSYFESTARQPARQQGQKDRHCVVFTQRREGVSAFTKIYRGLSRSVTLHSCWGCLSWEGRTGQTGLLCCCSATMCTDCCVTCQRHAESLWLTHTRGSLLNCSQLESIQRPTVARPVNYINP